MKYNSSYDNQVGLLKWFELENILEPHVERCFKGLISREEFFKICVQEKEKFIKKHKLK